MSRAPVQVTSTPLQTLWSIHFPFDAAGYPTDSSDYRLSFINNLSRALISCLGTTNLFGGGGGGSVSRNGNGSTPMMSQVMREGGFKKSVLASLRDCGQKDRQDIAQAKGFRSVSVHVVLFDYTSFTSMCSTSQSLRTASEAESGGFENFLRARPEVALACLGAAVGVYKQRETAAQHSNSESDIKNIKFLIRFKNYPIMPLKNIGSNVQGQFVSLKGHVLKASVPKLLIVKADFMCTKCECAITQIFKDGCYSCPVKCSNSTDNCRSRTFELLRSTGVYVDCQRITLQEQDTDEAGQVPRTITVEVTADLVDSCKAGDTATISGIVKRLNSEHFAGRGGKRAAESSLYILYLEGNQIANEETRKRRTSDKANEEDTLFTYEQLHDIRQLSEADPGKRDKTSGMFYTSVERNSFPFDLLVTSFFPEIYGHELTKAGLLLVLLGGTEADYSGLASQSGVSTRTNPHILIVGDPGMGKSQLLRRASDLASRSVFIGGNTSTTAGLTVSVVKEGADTTLEAGALVLADQGVCAIDEFDKMTCDENALLECMEQQEISIAKSGICASLPARCSIIAAANPKQGHYNPDKSVAENINMKTPLLSRFDLCFVLKDEVNVEFDERLTEHILGQHRRGGGAGAGGRGSGSGRGKNKNKNKDKQTLTIDDDEFGGGCIGCTQPPEKRASNQSNQSNYSTSPQHNTSTIISRLQKVGRQHTTVPLNIVKDYIRYAREYVKPKLSYEAAMRLQDYYLSLREAKTAGSLPITTRQLESMIRLTQARAKAGLREYVTVDDANDVIQLMTMSIVQVNLDAGGSIETKRGGVGGRGKMKEKDQFIKTMKETLEENGGRKLYSRDCNDIAGRLNMGKSKDEVYEFMSLLRGENSVIMKKDETGKTYWVPAAW